jgi:hypothetical protein
MTSYKHSKEPPRTSQRTLPVGDKLYDRRKTAALEVEGLIKNLAAQVSLYRKLGFIPGP